MQHLTDLRKKGIHTFGVASSKIARCMFFALSCAEEPAGLCGEPHPVPYATRSGARCSYQRHDQILYTCDTCHTGSDTITCLSGGTWSGNVTCTGEHPAEGEEILFHFSTFHDVTMFSCVMQATRQHPAVFWMQILFLKVSELRAMSDLTPSDSNPDTAGGGEGEECCDFVGEFLHSNKIQR